MYEYKAANYITLDMSFHIFKTTDSDEFPVHTHDFVEFVYVLDGEGEQVVEGHVYPVSRGDLVLIAYGATHTFRSVKGFTYYNICFSPEVMSARITDRNQALDLLSLTALDEFRAEKEGFGKLCFEGEARRVLEFLLRELLEEYQGERAERAAVLESYMTVLLAKIFRKARETTLGAREEFGGVWRYLSDFIDKNLQEKLTLSALAKKCFYNPSYFSRAFKQKFGVSLVEYVARERARRAEALLLSTQASMEEIAEQSGFGDKASLYRAFEKYYGCTPTKYRSVSGKKPHDDVKI